MKYIGRYKAEKCQPIAGLVTRRRPTQGAYVVADILLILSFAVESPCRIWPVLAYIFRVLDAVTREGETC